MSLALARKYRPKTFGSVAVQTHVSTTLKGAIALGRVAHGYLLCGPRGTGKTTLARVLAMALNCERKRDDGEPCGECTSCTRIWSGSASLDVIEIDAASNRGVEDARSLRERAMYAPSGDDRYKVYIVDEAHMLTREAWNTLLKILEEPPPRVVFVFATTEPQKIAQAASPVLSRLQRFDLKRIAPPEIRARLVSILDAEGVTYEDDALAMITRAADGSMRDALSLTDQVLAFGDSRILAESVRTSLGLVPDDEVLGLLDLIAERRAADVFAASQRLADNGADYTVLLTRCAELIRAQLAVELGGAPTELSERVRANLTARKGRIAAQDLVRMLSLIVEHEPTFRKSAQPQLVFDALLVRFALLDRTVVIEDVLAALGRTEPRAGVAGAGRDGQAREQPAVRDPAPRAAKEPVPTRAAPAALADAPRPAPAEEPVAQPLDINRMAERWDDIVAELRAAGKGLVAQLLEECTPAAVTAAGVVTLDAESELTVRGIGEAQGSAMAALRRHFPGVTQLQARIVATGPRRRYDATSIKADRVARLRRGDPLLAAAIDALDLELMD